MVNKIWTIFKMMRKILKKLKILNKVKLIKYKIILLINKS